MKRSKKQLWAAGNYYYTEEPVKPSRFEKAAKGIPEELWENSVKLRRFAEKYRNKYYVPQRLLDAWGMQVDVRLGPDR